MEEKYITLIEIKGKKFKEKFGGYDKRDVDEFVSGIVKEFERIPS